MEGFLHHKKQADIKKSHVVNGVSCVTEYDQRHQTYVYKNGNQSKRGKQDGFLIFANPNMPGKQRKIKQIDKQAVPD